MPPRNYNKFREAKDKRLAVLTKKFVPKSAIDVDWREDFYIAQKRAILLDYFNGKALTGKNGVRLDIRNCTGARVNLAFIEVYGRAKRNLVWFEEQKKKKEIVKEPVNEIVSIASLEKDLLGSSEGLEAEVGAPTEFSFATEVRNSGSPFRTEQEKFEYQLGRRPNGRRKR